MTLIFILIAFLIGLWSGREWAGIQYQRRIVELDIQMRHWQSVAINLKAPTPPGQRWPDEKPKAESPE